MPPPPSPPPRRGRYRLQEAIHHAAKSIGSISLVSGLTGLTNRYGDRRESASTTTSTEEQRLENRLESEPLLRLATWAHSNDGDHLLMDWSELDWLLRTGHTVDARVKTTLKKVAFVAGLKPGPRPEGLSGLLSPPAPPLVHAWRLYDTERSDDVVNLRPKPRRSLERHQTKLRVYSYEGKLGWLADWVEHVDCGRRVGGTKACLVACARILAKLPKDHREGAYIEELPEYDYAFGSYYSAVARTVGKEYLLEARLQTSRAAPSAPRVVHLSPAITGTRASVAVTFAKWAGNNEGLKWQNYRFEDFVVMALLSLSAPVVLMLTGSSAIYFLSSIVAVANIEHEITGLRWFVPGGIDSTGSENTLLVGTLFGIMEVFNEATGGEPLEDSGWKAVHTLSLIASGVVLLDLLATFALRLYRGARQQRMAFEAHTKPRDFTSVRVVGADLEQGLCSLYDRDLGFGRNAVRIKANGHSSFATVYHNYGKPISHMEYTTAVVQARNIALFG